MYRRMMALLTLLLSGRMMTLPYIFKAGGSDVGDPPAAWLMPLIGDAVVGLSALLIAYLIIQKKGFLFGRLSLSGMLWQYGMPFLPISFKRQIHGTTFSC